MLTEQKYGARISSCGRYRYALFRAWEEAKPTVAWIMLNPSTADAEVDDPTIRKCINISKACGFGSLVVANLFAWRATNRAQLRRVDAPTGGAENDRAIAELALGSQMVICAWGKDGRLFGRDAVVLRFLHATGPIALFHLGLNEDRTPKHPLYLPNSSRPIFWVSESTAVPQEPTAKGQS